MADTNTTTTNPENKMTAAAILSLITGLLGSVGSVVTSTQAVKAQKLELQGLAANAEAAADLKNKEILLAAYASKQAAYEAEVAKEKSTTTIRGIIIVAIVAIGGIFSFKYFKK